MTLVVVILCFALAWNWARKRWYWNKYQELLFAKDRIADSMEDPSHSGETGMVKALRAGWPVMVFAPDFTRFVGRNFPCQITWMKIDDDIAAVLGKLLGPSSGFWIRLEARFREGLRLGKSWVGR